jgi:hypothetical protein
MADRCEPDSNVTDERPVQKAKHPSGIAVTGAGMQIDDSEEQCAKAEAPMHESLDPA